MRKYIRDRLRFIMKMDESPHKLALAFGLGIFVAFTPTIGFHMITCLALAWMLRLSKLVIITASFVNNPWTIVPLYGFCIWLGLRITGSSSITPDIAWNDLSFTNAIQILEPYLWSYVVGTFVVGAAAGIISYFVFHWAVIHYRKMSKGIG